MSTSQEVVASVGAEGRAADLVLARIHLRLGSLSLARAELETMAGRNALDDGGILDLAEARWRTGDLVGAGEAAAAYLETDPDHALALAISAESQAQLGRPGEARRLAGRALARTDSIDQLFAGMQRSSVWPGESWVAVEPAGLLFAHLAGSEVGRASGGPDETSDDEASQSADIEAAPPHVDGPGLWDANPEAVATTLPDPESLLTRAREALAGDRPGQAAASLALALRARPSLAPAVLDLLAGRTEPVLALVRGDAHRIVGHEAEAMRDYAASVAAIGLERRSDEGRRRDDGRDRREPAAAEATDDPSEDQAPEFGAEGTPSPQEES